MAVAIVLLLPLMLLWAMRRRQWSLIGLTGLVVATLLLNAAITGDLSGPDDRYQSRVLWLLRCSPPVSSSPLLDAGLQNQSTFSPFFPLPGQERVSEACQLGWLAQLG